MKTCSSRVLALVCVLCVSIGIPDKNWAAPQETEVRAGEVSRVVFEVSIERGTQNISATTKTVVDWQDLINTQANARARVALDDGSVLNVGSSSSIRVVKHDVKAQQTDLEIGLGRMRTQVQKIPQRNGKFEVRTPAGVAGVVGTDFYVSYENKIMTVIVFEGVVRVCDLAGVCVVVNPEQMTTIRQGDPSGPSRNIQAPHDTVMDAVRSTAVEEPVGAVLTAQNAFVGLASAGVGTTLYSGDSISTDRAGSVQMSAKAARLFLTEMSAAVLNDTDGVLSARLLKGTAKFSTANARAFTLFASKAAIQPKTDSPTIAQVTYVSDKELLVLAQRGTLVVTVADETQTITEGTEYRVRLDETAQAQGGPPSKAGRSTFVLVAIGVVAVITGLAVSQALAESPSRP